MSTFGFKLQNLYAGATHTVNDEDHMHGADTYLLNLGLPTFTFNPIMPKDFNLDIGEIKNGNLSGCEDDAACDFYLSSLL